MPSSLLFNFYTELFQEPLVQFHNSAAHLMARDFEPFKSSLQILWAANQKYQHQKEAVRFPVNLVLACNSLDQWPVKIERALHATKKCGSHENL